MRNFLLACVLLANTALAQTKTQNVIFITMDGTRWQEVFGGAQDELLTPKEGGIRNPAPVADLYKADTPEQRRAKLMPFFWTVVAKHGQVFGDDAHGSLAHVANDMRFSYPGYNEMLTGRPDDEHIDSNNKVPNPNVTVLEYLNARPGFEGRVYAAGSWDVLPYILNVDRSKLPANGDGPPILDPQTPEEHTLNQIAADLPAYWDGARFDAVTMQSAWRTLTTNKPRVLYVMLGETDEWGHGRRYDLYLHAMHQGDDFIRRVWEYCQSDPQYAGKTTLILSTDHGRGAAGQNWTSHGKSIPESNRIWIAVMGPDTKAMGLRENIEVTQSQIAPTISAALHEDFASTSDKIAKPLPGAIGE
ncbi:MAG: hypothetical protein GC162_13465 [Planctomycetes bacterium]|nr:hypothetical protein [Planctomycetota bacterium]